MTIEEYVSLLSQPGMMYAFAFGVGFVLAVLFFTCLIFCLGGLFMSLIRRFIWPGKKPHAKEAPND